MTTKHKPSTPLPWEQDDENGIYPIDTTKNEIVGGCPTSKTGDIDAAYIVHTANAYPRLVEALQHTLALSNPRSEGQRYQYDKAYNLLRELGEE